MKLRIVVSFILLLHLTTINAQDKIILTPESAVDIAMQKSYKIRMLEMGVKSSTMELKAKQAALKTQVFMNLSTPDLQNISESKWNSDIGRDEIIRQNTRLWQSEISVMQPLIFFGYPTNGSVSLNYKLYQYGQTSDEGTQQTDFYNRLYLRFEQPFFLPNEMKNNLEEAELELQDTKLEFLEDQMEIVYDVTLEYFNLFERSLIENIYREQIELLEEVYQIANAFSLSDSAYSMDVSQIQLELNNIKEKRLSVISSFREKLADMRQILRLNSEDTVVVSHKIDLVAVNVDVEQAITFGIQNNPELKRLKVNERRSQISKENEEGVNAFHMTLEATYGLEKKNESFQSLWEQFDNSNSIKLNAYVPLWDGGERKYRVQAEELKILQNDLESVEKEEDIRKNIRSNFTSMNDYYNRALNMQKSIILAEEIGRAKINQYSNGQGSLNNLLQTIEQVSDTKKNFRDVYDLYMKSLLKLKAATYYDFEKNISLIDAFEMKYKNE